MTNRLCIWTLAMAPLATPSPAQVRAGGEFQVNGVTVVDQLSPSVSVGGTGDFVVVWSSSFDGGIFGRRYDMAGVPLGSEFRADVSTTVPKSTPTVASHRRGNFEVAWVHSSPNSIRGARLDAAAQALTGEMVLANPGFYPTRDPRLAAAPNGWFLLTHVEPGINPTVRAFEFKLFHPTTTNGSHMCGFGASGGANGGAAATVRRDLSWVGVNSSSFAGLEVRHFGSPPCTFGGPVPVTSPGPASLAMAADAYGNAVLVWMSAADGDQTGIRGRKLGALSAPQGAEFQVNAYTTGAQANPSVAVAADGNFVVAWQSGTGDGSGEAVFARRFRPDGTPREDDFVVNTYTTGAQRIPIAATDDNGNFVVVWEDGGGQDGDGAGVFAQRFGGIRASALTVDAAGNRMLEPNETVIVAPSWRNVNGLARSFTGAATSFSGPGPVGNPAYVLSDAATDYGTVADGTAASCTVTGNCFEVSVGLTSPRPVQHWDAALREEIAPAALGQSQVWSLHVGDSFPDVPRTSPFYRFIETLLHEGVTGGCTATDYCPTSATTREQMAAFVLVAREGADYANPVFPSLCSIAPFSDVPTTSPFCRWIQELARRGVVSGCGGGRYCPADPVRRDAMAVFVLATLEGSGYAPTPCVTPPFADVPVTSEFCPWIREMASRGVVNGCGGGNYCPASPVTREQMAVFMTVTFGLQLYGP